MGALPLCAKLPRASLTPWGPGSWGGGGARRCAPTPVRAERGAVATWTHCSPTLRAGWGGAGDVEGSAHARPARAPSPARLALRETLRSPGQGHGGRPRGSLTSWRRPRPLLGGLGAPPPPGGARPGAGVWRGSAGGRESPFVCAGKVRPRGRRPRLRAGGCGGGLVREHLLRVNAGRSGGGGPGSRTERRRPSFKGFPAAPPAPAAGGGGGGGGVGFPGLLLLPRKEDAPCPRSLKVVPNIFRVPKSLCDVSEAF